MKTGKVWAGGRRARVHQPLTIKAAEVQKADAIIYDSPIGTEILSALPKTADYIYVGKRSGQHTMPQEEINLLLLKEAQKGRFVVRLKGRRPLPCSAGEEKN